MEGAAAEDDVDGGVGEGDHGGGAEEREGDEAGDGAVDGGGEAGELVAAEERGEEGEGGCSGGLADDGHGGGEEALGVGEAGDVSGAVLGEVAEDLVVEGDDGDAEHEREGEANPLAEAGVFEVEDGLVAHAGAVGSVGVEEEGAEVGSGEGSDAERGDAHAAGEEGSAGDDAEVIDERREGLEGELFADEEDGGEDSAGEEEELAGEEDAGDVGAEDAFGRGGVEVEADVVGGEDLGEDDGGAEDEDHGVEDDGEGALAFGFVVVGAVAVEDGDEGDGGCSADEEVVDELGEVEGYVVGVGVVACAEFVGDELVADEADDAGEERGEGEEEGRGGGGVAVRWAKKVEVAAGLIGSGLWGLRRFEDRIGFVVCGHRVADLILSVGLMLMGWRGWFVG